MNELDFILLAVVALSAIWAMFRGFFRELVALVGWVAAILLTSEFSGSLEKYLMPWLKSTRASSYAASLAIFLTVLIVFAILGRVIKGWIASKGFSLGDRLAGLVFGLVRGGLIIIVAISIHVALDEPASRWTGNSVVYGYGKEGILASSNHLPENSSLIAKIRRMGFNNTK
ncbi:MAG: CvpA family protein [Magnetococcales bacterium]|nr:CvpA family protein [Magnetococcales bacterium]